MVSKHYWSLLKFYSGRNSFDEFLNEICDQFSVKFEPVSEGQPEPEQQTLIIGNHRSILDPIILLKHVRSKGLIKGHGISKPKWYARLFWFFVDRDNDDIQMSYLGDSGVFRKWIRGLREGRNVLFFPEGTRNLSDEPILPFQPGAEKLIEAAKPNLLIYHIPYSNKALESGAFEKPVRYKYFRFEDINEDVECLYRKTFDL